MTKAQLQIQLEELQKRNQLLEQDANGLILIFAGLQILYKDVSEFLIKEIPLLIKDIIWTYKEAKKLFKTCKSFFNRSVNVLKTVIQ